MSNELIRDGIDVTMSYPMSEEQKHIESKCLYMVNEARQIDYTFEDAIESIFKMIKSEYYKGEYKHNKHLSLNRKDYVYTGWAYSDLTEIAVRVHNADQYDHKIYLYMYYDKTDSRFGCTINKQQLLNIRDENGKVKKEIIKLFSAKFKQECIYVAVNMNRMIDDKVIKGTLWHEFSHVRKIFQSRFEDFAQRKKVQAKRFDKIPWLGIGVDLTTLGDVNRYLYLIDTDEEEANVQSIHGVFEAIDNSELEQLFQNIDEDDEETMIEQMFIYMDNPLTANTGYDELVDRTNKYKNNYTSNFDDLFQLLMISNILNEHGLVSSSPYYNEKFLEMLWNAGRLPSNNMMFDISCDVRNVIKHIEKNINTYKKKIKKVIRDELVKRGYVNPEDGIDYSSRKRTLTSKDIDVDNNRLRRNEGNFYDEDDKMIGRAIKLDKERREKL